MSRWKFFLLVACLTVIGSTVYVAIVGGTERPETYYKTSKLNPTDVAVTCKNGNNPVAKNYDDSLIIVSCAK